MNMYDHNTSFMRGAEKKEVSSSHTRKSDFFYNEDFYGSSVAYEANFLAALISGSKMDLNTNSASDLAFQEYERLYCKTEALHDVLDKLRKQLKSIIRSRRQQKQARALIGEIECRYAHYQAVLCAQDLRQHWLLYRRAVHELFQNKNELNKKYGEIEKYHGNGGR